LQFPSGIDATIKQAWQIAPAGADQPDVMYVGVEPAALFRSSDGGQTFELVRGLWDHPHRPTWQPGGGGLCLHTVLLDQRDPQQLTVAISTGGGVPVERRWRLLDRFEYGHSRRFPARGPALP
jgi:hypothetical protein